MKLSKLISKLQTISNQLGPRGDDMEVKGWLPGSTLSVDDPFIFKDQVRIELNVDPGSAIEKMKF